MKKIIIYLLRFLILLLIALPIVKPVLEKNSSKIKFSTVNILVPYSSSTASSENLILNSIRSKFSSNSQFLFHYYGEKSSYPLYRFNELGLMLEKLESPLVVVDEPNLWGISAQKFFIKTKELINNYKKDIYWLDPNLLSEKSNQPEFYIGINDIYLPSISFLNEKNLVSLEIIGKLRKKEVASIEVVFKSEESLLSSQLVDIQANEEGLINTIINVPVHFVKAGTQILTASINSPYSNYPLNYASTVVNVTHAKTTVLHIALGPDWSLRNFRQKLKFWPNFDLLSYYILREDFSEMNVPNEQMSLIKFPADKLFGEQLANFHGIIVQNFPFGDYLAPNETQNLLNYVKNGGRILLQIGPRSITARDSNVASIFPCDNEPHFDLEKNYKWETTQEYETTQKEFAGIVSNISSNATLIDCKVAPNFKTIAQTSDGKHPVMLAGNVGKGIVLAILGGDWHLYSEPTNAMTNNSLDLFNSKKLSKANSIDSLFQWLIEFVQRRHDSGMRPPDISGPRIYAEDTILAVHSRGLNNNQELALYSNTTLLGKGNTYWLDFFNTEVFIFNENSENSLKKYSSKNDIPIHESLNFEIENENSVKIKRSVKWPIFSESLVKMERQYNPILFANFAPVKSLQIDSSLQNLQLTSSQKIPLIEEWPFLLGLLLFLIALEVLLTRWIWVSSL